MATEPVLPATETPPLPPAAKGDESPNDGSPAAEPTRRELLGVALNTGVVLSLGVSYGTLAGHAVSYLVPTHSEAKAWLYVAQCRGIALGSQVKYTAPSGATIAVARIAEGERAESFIALSSTCPHMGCQVSWEGSKNRFFCPCHNGVFNERGEGTDGPPKGQSLARYPIQVENGLLFVEVPLTGLPRERSGAAHACTASQKAGSSSTDRPEADAAKRSLPVLRSGNLGQKGSGDEPA